MSVPVRYSAAANYAVVDCGLSNTLQQEEQYHQQQQQQQQQHQQYQQHQQPHQKRQQRHGEQLLFAVGKQQQQLMQQRSSMSSSVSPSKAKKATLPAKKKIASFTNTNRSSNTNKIINNSKSHITMNQAKSSSVASTSAAALAAAASSSSSATIKATTSSAAAAAAAISPKKSLSSSSPLIANSSTGLELVEDAPMVLATTTTAAAAVTATANGNDTSNDAEMRTEWMSVSDEGRYGTPGAAGLEYQKFELEQQQQQTPVNNNNDQPMEPSLMDNENTNVENSTNTTNNINNTVNNTPNGEMKLEDKLNALSSDELYNILKEYDALQDKYHTVLLLPKDSRREVTAGGRDGSAYVLRCLKMWYELPSDVLFNAMSLVDRFLDRMAVKPKHMACMSVASFYLAIKQLELKEIPAEDLVNISQCGCTAGDLERMAGVIANKLGVQLGHPPITSVSYLRIYYSLFRNVAKEIGGEFFEFYQQMIKLEDLENRLEVLLCDVKTTVITPSVLALVLYCLHLDYNIKAAYTPGRPELKLVFEYILFLQKFLNIPDRVFTCGFEIVSGILSHYNGQNKQPYKQRLVWKLSSRTLRVLRPTNRFSSDLPTIEESISNAMDDGCRSRTESLSSEEEEDWPTSPIIPIFEQC